MKKRNLFQRAKRGIATLLTAAMAVSSFSYAGGITSYAVPATELAPLDMDNNDGGTTTAYKWKQGAWFDIKGIGDGDLIGHENPYIDNDSDERGIMTTYDSKGYITHVGPSIPGNPGKDLTIVDEIVFYEGGVYADNPYNGGVAVYTDTNVINRGRTIEVQMKLFPSKDEKWIIVEYVIYNNSDKNVTNYNIGSLADVKIGDDDYAPLYRTSKGLRMVNRGTLETYELITQDTSIGVDNRDTGIRTWIGNYYQRYANKFNDNSEVEFFDGTVDTSGSERIGDSAITYSWPLNMRPYETITRRVAFGAKGPSYYVSAEHGRDTNSGTFNEPYKTIGKAVSTLEGKLGYVYIQDYGADGDISETYTISGSTNITFMSADYNRQGQAVDDIITLKRDAGFTSGPMFETSGKGTIRFSNLILDGNKDRAAGNDQPIVRTSGEGTVGLQIGAVLQNNKVTSPDVGSAIDVTGNAALDINYGTVQGNVSGGAGAIKFDSTGELTVQNDIKIFDNKDSTDEKSNIYLADGKYLTVKNDLGSSKIGVTTEILPESSVGGAVTSADQEVVVAVPASTYPGINNSCPFADNFFADLDDGNGEGVYTSIGSDLFGNGAKTVLKRDGYSINFIYKDARTGGTVTGAPSTPAMALGTGADVSVAPPASIDGYTFTGVTIDQGSNDTLTAETTEGTDFGTISGTMPGQDVVVTYEYVRSEGSIAFEVNGGTPQPDTLTGAVNSTVNALLPTINRYGYEFMGWSKVNDKENPEYITELPEKFTDSPITYYGIFIPDSNVKFDYTVDYTNKNGSIVFQSTTAANAYQVEAEVSSQQKNIHGYRWSLADSYTNPAKFDYDGTNMKPVGTFNTNGNFNGKMPAQNLAVRYGYTVDYSDPDGRSDLTVRYVTENGTPIHAPDVNSYFPEATISAAPVSAYGYRMKSGEITKGKTEGDLISTVEGSFDSQGNFTGVMPNQPVEITYTYETTGEGYVFSIMNQDNGTTDQNLKNIIEPQIQNTPSGSQVHAVYREFYGYDFGTETADPSTAGTFAGNHDYSGTMPIDNLKVTYKFNRDSSKWADITYRPGAHGSLSAGNGVSSDVAAQGDGTFKTSVLKNDLSALGAAESYTWTVIQEKRLVPNATADEYYRLAGWFIDSNGDGIKDENEVLVDGETRFTDNTIVTALFEEDPAKWIDVNFAAGPHGSINEGEPTTLHIPYDKTWGDIGSRLPGFTPEVNYLADGWFDGAHEMEAGILLNHGHTYTIRFYPDPNIFGTEVGTPDALGGINSQGKGKVTVYETTPGYDYIITDLDGNIIGVETGNISDRVIFDDLYPGQKYHVYEAEGNSGAQPGMNINTITNEVSDPKEVLIPVVEENYQVLFDEEHEGKTVLVIKPADEDSDYAILDKDGNVIYDWKTPTGSGPSTITFPGLNYNEEYVVVARPKGDTDMTAESKFPDGTTLVMDPGGELNIPNYIVETINGNVLTVDETEIGSSMFDEVHKGDEVVISADDTDSAGGQFKYWKVTVGAIPGLNGKIRQKDLTFTMPDTNVVLTAYYTRPVASPSTAAVVDEVRGGNESELALDPNEIPDLEDLLTTEEDRTLMDVNNADVTYKVIYRKNKVKSTESELIKNSAYYDNSHEEAYHGAWGLNVDIERYVNGRKTEMATPSDAAFNTYVQLDREDVDMMDYQLYSISVDPATGDPILSLVPMSADPEQTGGLFTFTAEAGMRYVLVYSKAYRVYFINNHDEPKYSYYFKVRKGEAPGDSDYDLEYGQLEDPRQTFISNDGVEFTFVKWSYKENKLSEFDPFKVINKKTYVYAFYKDNSKEVEDARKDLEDAINNIIDKSDDYFLTNKESEILKDAIKDALDVLEKTNPKATLDELLDAIERLEEASKPIEEILDDRYDDYDKIQEESSKGGSGGSGGGSGSGSKKSPYVPVNSKSYVVGTNGNWELIDKDKDHWIFVLNGGIRLKSMWARLEYTSGDLSKTGWYHFNADGIMDIGWFRDEALNWYYCNTVKDGWLGKMKTGWHYDESDKHWYYLDLSTGMMATGWHNIGGKWYYFTAQNQVETYYYDHGTSMWVYNLNGQRPLGSMYENEITPDGYRVTADGAWTE